MLFDGVELTEDRILRVLLQMQQKMNRHNWIKKSYGDQHGNHCLVGWIEKFAGEESILSAEVQGFILMTWKSRGRYTYPLEEWNDRPSRKFADVSKLIAKCIAKRQQRLLIASQNSALDKGAG